MTLADIAGLTENWMQQVASSLTIFGAAVGSFLDCVPRSIGFRWTLVAPIALLFLGGSIACGLNGVVLLLIGRFLVGVASGLAGIVAPVLLAESSAPMVRGKLTALHQLGFTFGVLLSSVFGLGMVRNVVHGWRYVFWAGALFPLFLPLGACLGLLPESPRWLIRWGGSDGKKRAYYQLLGLRPLEHDVRAELRAMVKEARREETGRTDEISSSGSRHGDRARPGRRRRSRASASRGGRSLLQQGLLDADSLTQEGPLLGFAGDPGAGGMGAAGMGVPGAGAMMGSLTGGDPGGGGGGGGFPAPGRKHTRSKSSSASHGPKLLAPGTEEADGVLGAESKGMAPNSPRPGDSMMTAASVSAATGASRSLAVPVAAVAGSASVSGAGSAMVRGSRSSSSGRAEDRGVPGGIPASAGQQAYRKTRASSQGTGVVLSKLQGAVGLAAAAAGGVESSGSAVERGRSRSRRGSGRGGNRSRAGSDETLRDVAAAGVGHALPVSSSGEMSISWCALMCEMRNRHLLYPVFVGCMLVLGLSGCGVNVVLLYSSRIYGLIELHDPMLATCITFGVFFVTTIGGMFLVDMLGRRTLLAAGYAVMFVALAALGVTVLTLGEAHKEASGYIALACLLVFVAGYAVGPGVATFVVLSEIVPTVIRVRAFSIFMVTNWTVQLLLGLLALDAIGLLGTQQKGQELHEQARRGVGLLFLGFSAVCLLAIGAVLGLVPETRGKSLESVRKAMLSRWKRVETETRQRRRVAQGATSCCDWCICCAAGRAALDRGDGTADLRDDDSEVTSILSRAESSYRSSRYPRFAPIEGDGSVGGPDEGEAGGRVGLASGMPASTPLAIAEASTEDVARVPLGGYSAMGRGDDTSGTLQIPSSSAALVQAALA
jgi:MFS family permease